MDQAPQNIIDSKICDYQNESSLIEGVIMKSSYAGVSLKKGLWTEAEDEILMDYVIKYGIRKWSDIHRSTGLLRSGKSCRLRWVNHLSSGLKKGAFTLEEERLIVDLQAKVGNKWALMTEYLPGRTDNDIKNFWNSRLKRLRRAGLPYSSKLCYQALPRSFQAHKYGTPSSCDKHRHAMVQAINFETRDTLYNDQHKRLQESPARLPSSGPSTRRSVFSSRAKLAGSCDTSSNLLSSFPVLHHLPASGVKLEPVGFELPSIQNIGTHPDVGEERYLPCLPLESFDDFQNVPSPMENIKLETPSDSGLLQSFLPDFNASNSAIDLFTAVTSPLSLVNPCRLEGTRGLNLREMDQKHIVSPTSSFGPSVLPFHGCSPTSTSTSWSVEKPVVYTFPGCNEAVEQAPDEAETGELSNWLNLSSANEFLDMECIWEDATCGINKSIDTVDLAMPQLTDTEQLMITGSTVPNPGREHTSYISGGWNKAIHL